MKGPSPELPSSAATYRIAFCGTMTIATGLPPDGERGTLRRERHSTGSGRRYARRHRRSAGLRESGAGSLCRPRRYDRRCVCRAGKAGLAPRPAGRRRRGTEIPGLPLPEILRAGGAGGAQIMQRRYRRHGLCAAVRAAGILRDPEARHDPVSSLGAAAAPRPGLDPLGDHPRPQRNRADDLPPNAGARRRACHSAEARRDRPQRHCGLALFRQDLPARRRGVVAGGRSRHGGPRHRMDAG